MSDVLSLLLVFVSAHRLRHSVYLGDHAWRRLHARAQKGVVCPAASRRSADDRGLETGLPTRSQWGEYKHSVELGSCSGDVVFSRTLRCASPGLSLLSSCSSTAVLGCALVHCLGPGERGRERRHQETLTSSKIVQEMPLSLAKLGGRRKKYVVDDLFCFVFSVTRTRSVVGAVFADWNLTLLFWLSLIFGRLWQHISTIKVIHRQLSLFLFSARRYFKLCFKVYKYVRPFLLLSISCDFR